MNLACSNVNIMRFLIIDEINLNLNQHRSPFTTNSTIRSFHHCKAVGSGDNPHGDDYIEFRS